MSWLHTWVGLLLAVVLYFMFITGSVGYVNSEVGRWMQPELPMVDTQSRTIAKTPPSVAEQARLLESAADYLRAKWPDAKEWWIALPHGGRGGVEFVAEAVLAPLPGDTEDRYEITRLDPTSGRPLTGEARETGGGDALYSMHYALHYMPYEVAIYTVGLATMFMLVAIVTGIVVHKKIFADFFTFRRGKGQRSWLDAHNLSSVLALPFMVMITYSGLIFYTYDYMPAAKTAFYGWGEAGYEAMAKDAEDPYARRHIEPAQRAATMTRWEPLMQAAEARWSDAGQVRYVHVINPDDAKARIVLERRGVGLQSGGGWLTFDGVSGRLVDVYEGGGSDPVDGFAQTMLALHEGRFAGPLLRWLYLLTGLLGAAMVATGMVLWTAKRRQQLKADEKPDAGLRFVERMNVGTIVGLPVGIAIYFWANRLLPIGMADRAAWEMHALFIAWGLCFVHAMLRPARRAWFEQFALAGALFALLPLLNALTTDKHLAATLRAGDWVLASFDLSVLVLGVVLLACAWKTRQQATAASVAAPRIRASMSEAK
jgi:uncharacterized iron-regulated membrane protein